MIIRCISSEIRRYKIIKLMTNDNDDINLIDYLEITYSKYTP